MNKKQSSQNYFNIYQPHLDPVISNYTQKVAYKLADALQLNSKEKILEVGCGSGRFSVPLTKKGLKITGLDFSKELIMQLDGLNNDNIKTILGDIDHIGKLTNEKFAKIIGFFILHHLNTLQKSLTALRGVSRPGTVVGFVEPNPFNPMFFVQPFLYKNMSWNEEKGFIKMTPKNLESNFQKAGFIDFRIQRFGFSPPFVVNTKIGVHLDSFLEKRRVFLPILPLQLVTARVK